MEEYFNSIDMEKNFNYVIKPRNVKEWSDTLSNININHITQ